MGTRLTFIGVAAIWLALPTSVVAAEAAVPFEGWAAHGFDRSAFAPVRTRDFAFASDAIGARRVGLAIEAGFPFLSVSGGYGLADGVDLRLAFRSMYAALGQLDLSSTTRLFANEDVRVTGIWGLSAGFRGIRSAAPALSGTRDYGVSALITVSALSRIVVFLQTGVRAWLDQDPAPLPLGGAPPPIVGVVNIPILVGLELPATDALSFHARIGAEARPGQRFIAVDEAPLQLVADVGLSVSG